MIQLAEAAAMYETVFARVSLVNLRPSELLFSADLGPRRGSMTLQDIYSPVIALIGTLVTLPVMAVVAILAVLNVGGWRDRLRGQAGARRFARLGIEPAFRRIKHRNPPGGAATPRRPVARAAPQSAFNNRYVNSIWS
jgi:hypothetical protein